MKVLHFFKTYFTDTMGGTEQVIYQIARGSAEHGIQTEILSLAKDKVTPTIVFENHRVHRARLDFQIASTWFSASSLRRFSQLAKQVDLIHYHFPWPFMDVVHFATRINKPTVVTYHSDIIRQQLLLKVYRPLMHHFLRSVDCIVATSPNYFQTSGVLNRYRQKTAVIPIGLDKASYPDASPELMDKWRSLVGDRFFLFVGMLRYYKGLHILLESVKTRGFPVVIVGSGPVETELKARARHLGLKHIHFLGALPDQDKVALLRLCFAVIFPSHLRAEAFGVSLLEGAMFGKPMISSEIGTGTSFVNSHGRTGLVVPPSEPAALRNAMGFLWNNPEIAAQMGRRAEARYWKHFTADRMVGGYVDLYHRLMEQAPGKFPQRLCEMPQKNV